MGARIISVCRQALVWLLVACAVVVTLSSADRTQAYADEGDGVVDVLFVGNSFTYYSGYGVAEALRELAAANGKQLAAGKVSYYGASLSGYALASENTAKQYAAFETKLASRSWDYVVFQEKTLYPIDNQVRMYSSIRKLAGRVHAVCPNAKTLLYMTHGYADGSSCTVNGTSRVLSISDMEAYVQGYYASAGQRLGISTVPVGLSLLRFAESNADIDMYAADRKHASKAGFLLAACCFYRTLFGEAPQNAPSSAASLGTAAWEQMVSLSSGGSGTLSPTYVTLAVGQTTSVELVSGSSDVPAPIDDTPAEGPAADADATADNPGSSDDPSGSGDSDNQGDPGNPDNPGNSDNPDNLGNPDSSDNQDNPDVTGNPNEADGADDPANPDNPENPSNPNDPDNPDDPDSPDDSSMPAGETWGYFSLDPQIASVDASGKIHANKVGKTVIVAQSDTGDRSTCYVSVETSTLLFSKLMLAKSTLSAAVGSSATMVPQVSESLGSYALTWYSSNSSIATVDFLGTVKAKAAGYAYISVKDQASGCVASRLVKVKLAAPKKLKISQVNAKLNGKKVVALKLTWKRSTGATGYKVYRSVDGGRYANVGTVKKASYVDKSAPANKNVSYKVVAINGNSKFRSDKSDSVKGVFLTKSKLKAKNTRKGISLSWGKRKRASGYIIYRAAGKNGAFERIQKLTSNKTTKWVDTTVKKGRTYRYKVRSYAVIDDVTFCSKCSKAAQVKAKRTGAAKSENVVRLVASM